MVDAVAQVLTWRQHEVLGVYVHDLSIEQLRSSLHAWIVGDHARMVVTPNPEFVMYAQHDAEFRKLLNCADLSLPDGVGLRFAIAALTEGRLAHRHTGADTLILLAELCALEQRRLMLLGGSPKKTQRAAASLRERFPGLDVVTFDPGIIDEHHVRLSEATLAGVERLAPHAVAVALGQGKQERVMGILRSKIPSVRVLIGVGGAADYVSMAVKRAPTRWQQLGFEWLWRLLQEPWRWRRIVQAVLFFPVRVAWATITKGGFLRALKNVRDELRVHFS